MNKLYYDCPIEAAYMAKNFKVNFTSEGLTDAQAMQAIQMVKVEGYTSWYDRSLNFQWTKGTKLYVHSDSYMVFKPQIGDIGKLGKSNLYIYDDRGWEDSYDGALIFEHHGNDPKKVKVIDKGSKPFFTPKEINDE